jgi:hypothetical protein
LRAEAKLFGIIAGFLLIAASVYAYGTWADSGHVEITGAVVFGLSGVMSGVYASYFWLVARRIPPRPEDRGDAEIADGAGPIGSFAPSGLWQVGIASCVGFAAVGIAAGELWLTGVAGIGLLFTVAGLVFEFYVGEPHS